eukprot:NODE_16487_length_396_cov_86.721612_g16172_i0.p2 GENE.NODE_16487_length_396_cov_86.721612_g16172_i0~~NODE_16487_length_396_cov_86.721612_g16172_i0.p2  ORF type:complete len:101 (+),score=15.30 NODE_16487_length_396_cov_86.721612_g16172_i0:1-303(+)
MFSTQIFFFFFFFFFFFTNCDRNRESWVTFYKVSGAIQWVDDPLYVFIFTFDKTLFFSNDTVLRVRLLDSIDDDVFCFFIYISDKVISALKSRFYFISVF